MPRPSRRELGEQTEVRLCRCPAMKKRRKLPANLSEGTLTDVFEKHIACNADHVVDRIHDHLAAFFQPPEKSEEIDAAVKGGATSSDFICLGPDQYSDGPQIRYACETLSLGGRNYLEGIHPLPEVDCAAYKQQDIDPDSILEWILFHWFPECWFKAGGWYFERPVVLVRGSHPVEDDMIRLTRRTDERLSHLFLR